MECGSFFAVDRHGFLCNLILLRSEEPMHGLPAAKDALLITLED
jgi:hypothetical protein